MAPTDPEIRGPIPLMSFIVMSRMRRMDQKTILPLYRARAITREQTAVEQTNHIWLG